MAFSLISHVSVPGSISGGTSSAINTTGANFIAFAVGYYEQGTGTGVSDSKGNTYTLLTTYASGAFQTKNFIAYCLNPVVGSGHTFTVGGSNIYSYGQVSAFSGAAASSVFDTENGQGVTGSFTTVQPGSVTPASNGSLIVTGLAENESATSFSINAGFTITDQSGNIGGTQIGGGFAYLVQGSATAVNPTWTLNATSTFASAAIAVFKAAAGGARGLFLPPPLSGLGSGGSFFADRLT